MDFIKLKVLFQSLVLLVAYANIAGVNSLESNLNNLSTATPSSNSQTVTSRSSSKAPTNEYVSAPKSTQTKLNSMANADMEQTYGGKLLVDEKDTDASIRLPSNTANLTEARITSITFRSEDGDVDASGIDKENTETISFGIRSFTVEVAAPATEKPIPLNDNVDSAANENPSPERVLSSVPISTYDDKLLSERIKVFQPSAILMPDFEQQQQHHQQQQQTNSPKLDEQGNGQSNMENKVKTSANNGNDAANKKEKENDNGLNTSGITIVPVKLTSNTQTEMIGSSTSTSMPMIINNNNEHEQLSISSNGMHVEQKLENGLYRIKIAEIITDEFNNGHSNDNGVQLNADDAIRNEHKINTNDNLNMRPPIPLSRFNLGRASSNTGNNDGQGNIADLYPPKLEDFTSIIRESNEKLIKGKNRLVGLENSDGDDDSSHVHDDLDNRRFNIIDDRNEQENAIRFNSGGGIIGSAIGEFDVNHDKQQTQINGPINSIENNIPTTKIEIELIDEPGTSKDVKIIGPSDDDDDDYVNPIERTNANDKVTDFTSKLQVNDELISKIEQSFRDTSMTNSLQHPVVPEPFTINKPVNPMGFIERRTKKFDPAYKKRLMENREKSNDEQVKRVTRPVDIDPIAANTISSSDNEREDGAKYSTTKFYNGNGLISELIHTNGSVDSQKAVNSSEFNRINGTTQHKHGINSPSKDAMGRQPIDANDQKILFINVNNNSNNKSNNNSGKIDQTEIDRLQKHRQQIIKDSQRPANATESMVIGEQQHQQRPSKNMHLYIIHDDVDDTSIGRKSSEFIKTNYEDSNNERLAATKIHSIATNGETTAMPLFLATRASETVVPMKTTSNNLSTQTSVHAISSTESNLVKHSSSLNPIIETTTDRRTVAPPLETTAAAAATTTTTSTTAAIPITNKQSHQSHSMADYYQKERRLYDGILLEADCDMQTPIPNDSTIWRGNETHDLNLPTTTPERCSDEGDCMPMIISWEGAAEIQSGDVLIVEIDDTLLLPADQSPSTTNNIPENGHRATTSVYQVTRPGHEHCDATEGILLDITPLIVDEKKLVTLYDKDLTEGVNLLIVVSDLWGPQCVRLKVTVKSDNCGENAQCSEKGICFSNPTMEGYECQCCTGFAGSHCEEIDACSPSPCTNNGICVDLSQGHDGHSYQCLCPYGYSGKNCQFETDPCQNGECQNGGTCTGNATHFRCECAPGFTGPLCQHNLNECESSPCVHGICVDQEDGFRCFCQPGFSGELCNFEYNECDSNPCLNNGECTDHIGGFSCKCTRGFTGKRCHLKVDFCANNPCPEGHECHDHGNDFSCECPEGKAGIDCSQFPKTKCNVNPCANGGTCWRSVESFYCACRAGFTGRMCEDEFILDAVVDTNEILTETDSATTHARPFDDSSFSTVVAKGTTFGLHNIYIAIGTFAAAIFIVSTVLCICHCQYHKTYRHFKNKHKKLIPFFGFEFGLNRRNKKQLKHPKHWLSGKGNLSSANKTASTTALNQSNLNNSNGVHTANGTTQPEHQQQPQQLPNVPRFQRHLAMNLENDMYYTVDFSDSQHSPLIH